MCSIKTQIPPKPNESQTENEKTYSSSNQISDPAVHHSINR